VKKNENKGTAFFNLNPNVLSSEKRIENLKTFYQERGVPLRSKWHEMEEIFRND